MKKLIVILGIALIGCTKEEEKPRCYICETNTTEYRTPYIVGYPKKSSGNYESCTNETGEKTIVKNVGATEYRTIIETKCNQK